VGIEAGLDFVTRYWLVAWLAASGAFIALPYLAPLLARAGWTRAAGWIYLLYLPTCHQLPHHSWFLFGPRAHYDWPTIQPFTSAAPHAPLEAFHEPVRAAQVGFQAAICQRDTAIWAAVFLASLAYAWSRRRNRRAGREAPGGLAIGLYLLAMVPIAIDGLTGLVGLRESTPLLRTLTGGLFGAATAWFVLPQLEAGFAELDEGGGLPAARSVSEAASAAEAPSAESPPAAASMPSVESTTSAGATESTESVLPAGSPPASETSTPDGGG
jgi:uncharacterized membrane protein